MDNKAIYDVLRKWWGYGGFRPGQEDVIGSVLGGRDTLALMPTGAGKSLMYQVPAMVKVGVCIVITPLIALMKDQVDGLRRLGIPAAAIHSGLTRRQIDLTLDNASWGDLKLLYIAPERIGEPLFRERAARMNVSLIAVDEAHCISQWGYDFRPSYLRIAELRPLAPQAPVLALTASATPRVAEDIMRHLKMEEGRVVRGSFARPNISLAVRRTDDKQGQMLRIAENVGGSGIVYTRTREQAEKVAEWLAEKGVSAEAYHAGMGAAERSERQERWTDGRTGVMVSTNAFGMGIDKADVRFVVHFDVCDSPEAYYQEAGRAGRDGRRSYAVLLAASDDESRAAKRFETEFPPLPMIKQCYESLFNYLQIGIGDGKYASFTFNIHDFAGYARMYTSTAVNALKILQQNGYLTLTRESENPPRIMFTVDRDDLYKIRIEREELDHLLRTVLRLYEGLFGGRLVPVDEQEIGRAAGYTAEHVHELLKKLWRLRVITYVPGSYSPMLILHEERLPTQDVYISPESYLMRKEMAAARLEAMQAYAANTERCRSAMLQEYFGEEGAPDCGVCDVCLAGKRERPAAGEDNDEAVREKISALLRRGPITVKEIVDNFTCNPSHVIAIIDEMAAEGRIIMRDNGKVELKQ